ncbi:MAG: alpha-glucosidase C-terminal domain-containing protein [Candidatus Sericytochromatia bacterium]|nr:alpha-glucosidase C-terminal domain-containing protein [Candidatus Sericytochromatia bacterium]
MAVTWANDAVFYHVYPLGMCGAPQRNDFHSPSVARLAQLFDWIDHWRYLGVTALCLGPLFESTGHGYDTVDYFHVDRRLGDNAVLRELVAALHGAGIRVVLDGVFNHTGRDFWAFRDIRQHGRHSAYRDWYDGVDFRRRSPAGDSFTYNTWRGAYELPKLNLLHKPVRQHLLEAVDFWIREFDIDGLRLDACNLVKAAFLRELGRHSRKRKPDFWLMGEVVNGNYAPYMKTRGLDSVTNYNAYAGLVSSHNRHNYVEIAATLKRQFGSHGVYQGAPLYAFVDNHDVNRIGSRLRRAAHLYPAHLLLFTMPGVPSLYYGSEWGIKGARSKFSDAALRPAISRPDPGGMPHAALADTISRLSRIRQSLTALRHGNYDELFVQPEQFAFARHTHDQAVIVALNAAKQPAQMTLWVPHLSGRVLHDVLNPGDRFQVHGEHVTLESVPAHWGRILIAS